MEDSENDYEAPVTIPAGAGPGGQMMVVGTEQLDRGGDPVARVRTTLKPKQEMAARIRRENPSASEGQVLRAAGYAESTSRQPGNNDLDSRRWLAQLESEERKAGVEVKTPTLATLKTKSLTAIDTALEPNSEIGTLARAQLGGSVVKLASEVGAEDRDDEIDARSSIMHAHREMRQALRDVLRGIDLCVEVGADVARAAIEERLNEIPADTYWDRQAEEMVDLDARLGNDLILICGSYPYADRGATYQAHRKRGFPIPPPGSPGRAFIRDLK